METPSRDEIAERVRRVIAETFGVEDRLLVAESTFRGTLQLDSMEIVQLIEEIEHEFGMRRGENSLEAYARLEDIGSLVGFIEKALARE